MAHGGPQPAAGRAWQVLRAALSIAVLGATSAWALAVGPGPSASTGPAAVHLYDDDQSSPMFTLTDLPPGRSATRCIRVAYRGPSPALVRMTVGLVGDGLAKHLQTRIEVGTGGGFADCRGFRGSRLFDGTLAELAAGQRDARSGLPAFRASGDDERTFRFTVALDDIPSAQTGEAELAFVWQADTGDALPPPSPGQATASPRPPSRADSPDSASSEHASPLDAWPSVSSTPRSRGGSERSRPAPRRTDGRSAADGPANMGSDGALAHKPVNDSGSAGLIARAAEVAPAVLERSALPLLLVVFVALFLLVQDRIDRRDPKLALAPVHADPDLAFADPGPPPAPAPAGGER